MPGVRKSSPVIAVCSSDWHISHKPPLARSTEESWYKAMGRTLRQVFEVQAEHQAPLVIAGDLFDSPNQPAEVVNWLMAGMVEVMSPVYAIPGQHDLPFHSYADRRKSAYWTLVEADRIINLAPGKPVEFANCRLHGFPFGKEIKPLKKPHSLCLDVAVCHSYIWDGKAFYEGAPKNQSARKVSQLLAGASLAEGYDAAVFGDNHIHFEYWAPGDGPFHLWNCGTLMRRKQDERGLHPSVGLLHEDGSITRHKLDCSQDKFLEPEEIVDASGGIGMETFIEELSSLGNSAVNFADAVKRILERDKVPDGVKRVVLRCLEAQ